jgi:hypothetical protein
MGIILFIIYILVVYLIYETIIEEIKKEISNNRRADTGSDGCDRLLGTSWCLALVI